MMESSKRKKTLAKEVVAFSSIIIILITLTILMLSNNAITALLNSHRSSVREKELTKADSLMRRLSTKLLISASKQEQIDYTNGEIIYNKWKKEDVERRFFKNINISDFYNILLFTGLALFILLFPVRYLIVLTIWAIKILKT